MMQRQQAAVVPHHVPRRSRRQIRRIGGDRWAGERSPPRRHRRRSGSAAHADTGKAPMSHCTHPRARIGEGRETDTASRISMAGAFSVLSKPWTSIEAVCSAAAHLDTTMTIVLETGCIRLCPRLPRSATKTAQYRFGCGHTHIGAADNLCMTGRKSARSEERRVEMTSFSRYKHAAVDGWVLGEMGGGDGGCIAVAASKYVGKA